MAAYEARSYAGGPVKTTLVNTITSGATSFDITTTTGWPTGSNGPFTVVLDRGNAGEEKIDCVTLTGSTIAVNGGAGGRGFDGTSAAAHTGGVAAEISYSARDFSEANLAVNKTVGKATAAGQILVVDAANSFAAVQAKTSGQILVGNGSTLVSVAVSGDATLSSAGVLTLASPSQYTVAASAPSSPVHGTQWYDSTNNLLKFYNGTVWIVTSPQAAQVTTNEATTSTTMTDLATSGPAVSLLTGTTAIVKLGFYGDATGGDGYMGFAVSGATTIAANKLQAARTYTQGSSTSNDQPMFFEYYLTGLTAGSNTFTAKYARTTDQANSCGFRNRQIIVQGVVG